MILKLHLKKHKSKVSKYKAVKLCYTAEIVNIWIWNLDFFCITKDVFPVPVHLANALFSD